ncbi:hypothetical protein PC114_g12554 [Phytophthora cactorum]|nr:hypothetical protein PC114_g12554 [Phytophthora cactorum]
MDSFPYGLGSVHSRRGHGGTMESMVANGSCRAPLQYLFPCAERELHGLRSRGMNLRVVEDAIEDDFNLAEPGHPRIAAGAPPRVNRDGIHIFMRTGLGEPHPDSDGESRDADSASDGLGSPNSRGASLDTSLFARLRRPFRLGA